MVIRSFVWCVVALVPSLLMVMLPQDVQAAVANQPCHKPGSTSVSDDQHSMLACLYDDSHTLVWTGLAAQTSSVSHVVDDVPSESHVQSNEMLSLQQRWQGWYAGGNVGLADTTNSYNALDNGFSQNLHRYGGTVGVVGGYNWVRSNGLFYGPEADINYMHNDTNWSGVNQSMDSTWRGYATMRGRIGLAFDPALVFLTGGLALADVSNKYTEFVTNNPGFSSSGIDAGWTVGAGAEFALTDTISMSAEYLRLEMPQTTQSFTNLGAPYKFVLDDSANILRVGLNWHFD